jgi:hypothetical protein
MTRLLPAILLSAALLSAQDVASGDWTVAGEVEGVAVNEICSLVQTDAALAGSCEGMGKKWDTTGTVAGKKITFKHGGEYNGDALTLTYTGIVQDDGSLKGSIDVSPMDVGGYFTAKKAAAKPASGL